ncbi:hypothetical protein EI546_01730 [Aequorivita sp. H23M31]|uniref:Lipoprotein n=1 Tax=Aequorivita ciconiae TaxID=2494375 RepID=A0A410FZS5_9FLAO|nr:hypothetical protein [Aequorivita sp. H23M31]QAA80525.1 hypothetical protein EI546_01730 [Aequorivita sp. H23M31]
MKKTILTVAIFSALLISCNENKNKETKDSLEATEMVHEHSHETDGDLLGNEWINEIQLDKGNKWEANPETTEGVEKMIDLIKSNEKETVEDYHKLASDLNEMKNYVVKKCTMQGPSHDNLHIFLHPLIEKINELGKVSTTERGSEITESIKENLDNYFKFFN